jgi:hypothetical protein
VSGERLVIFLHPAVGKQSTTGKLDNAPYPRSPGLWSGAGAARALVVRSDYAGFLAFASFLVAMFVEPVTTMSTHCRSRTVVVARPPVPERYTFELTKGTVADQAHDNREYIPILLKTGAGGASPPLPVAPRGRLMPGYVPMPAIGYN